MTQWFQKDDVWHAFELSDPGALCGEARITYGVDPIADFVPAGSTAHAACTEALAAATAPSFQPEPADAPEPDAEGEDAEGAPEAVKPKPKRRTKSK